MAEVVSTQTAEEKKTGKQDLEWRRYCHPRAKQELINLCQCQSLFTSLKHILPPPNLTKYFRLGHFQRKDNILEAKNRHQTLLQREYNVKVGPSQGFLHLRNCCLILLIFFYQLPCWWLDKINFQVDRRTFVMICLSDNC